MQLHSFHIFNRKGDLLFYKEWGRPKRSEKQTAEDHKLMFGFLFSLKQLVQKLAPRGASGGFHTCSTSTYKLNYFETPSGFRFVLCTDLRSGDMREALRHIYADIFVEHLTKNPLWVAQEPISCTAFVRDLDAYLGSLA